MSADRPRWAGRLVTENPGFRHADLSARRGERAILHDIDRDSASRGCAEDGRAGSSVTGADITALVARARGGEPLAVARLLSLVEAGGAAGREVAAALTTHRGRAHVVGLTGPPGVGKSTTTSALVASLRARGERVGVLAVDPSSPFSGGALLGDRVRMAEHTEDAGVFIRSMATRGQVGGLAWTTPQALRVLDTAGCDIVLIETVGVGQSEIDVVALADTTVVLLAPGMGDGVQAAKAGILEVADVFVVNKADRDGAAQAVRELRHMIGFGKRGEWTVPVLRTVASQREGIDELLAALDAHRSWSDGSGERERRRAARVEAEIEAIALERLRARIADVRGRGVLSDLSKRVVAGELDAYAAADELEAALTHRDEPDTRPVV
jgi:LAO/AO transport system kinase